MEIPTNRNISFLLESHHSMTQSLSELSSFKETFASLERSLSESLHFYKSLLEKSEIHSQTFSDQVLKTFKVFDEKIANLFQEILKKTEKEADLIQRIENLSVQLDMEKENVTWLREQEKKLNAKVVEMEIQVFKESAKNTLEKQKLFEIYLKNIQDLNEKIELMKKDTGNENKEFVEKMKISENNEREFFPVVDEDVLQKALVESLVYQEKYEKGQKAYQDLKEATEALLKDIEEKTPEITLARVNYDLLLTRYEDLSNEFYQYKQKHFSSKQEIDSLNKKLSASSEVIISLKSKISSLVGDIFSLTQENQSFLSNQSFSPEKSLKLLNSIEENYSLRQELEKSQQLESLLKEQIFSQSLQIQGLSKDLSLKEEEISNLLARVDLLNDLSEHKEKTFNSLQEEMLRQESQQKDFSLKSFKSKLSEMVSEIESLKKKNNELNDFIQSRNSLLLSQSQELFALKMNKAVQPSSSQPVPSFSSKKIENFSSEGGKGLEVLLRENRELTEQVLKLSQVLSKNKEEHSDQLAVLQAQVDVLRLVKQNESHENMKEDLVKTKNYLKEVRCLLAINEKELQEERAKRVHSEKNLKKLRKVLRNKELRQMSKAETFALKNEIQVAQNTIKALNQQILELQSNSEIVEKNLQATLDSTRENLLHQMKTNEVHSRNIKKLINSFNELSKNLEIKSNEKFFRDSYFNETKTQKKIYQEIVSGNLQGKEINEMCLVLQRRFESLISVQDQNSFNAVYQIEELRNENKKLKIDLKNFEVSEEKYREMVRKAEIVNQELKDKIEKSKEISKNPEVLMKIVRLIHKSTLADKKVN